jgi:crossover junction endodeoxyribonuclease RuvC
MDDLFMGIDPGLSGAWAVIDSNGRYVSTGDMINEDGRVLTRHVWAEMVMAVNINSVKVAVERVHSMPKQGVATTFAFGAAYGCALTLGNMFEDQAVLVTPNQWKKFYGLDSDKNKSSKLAQDMWPGAPIKLKKHNGRAEALLIANYLRLRIE